jgi:hypothetical protein
MSRNKIQRKRLFVDCDDTLILFMDKDNNFLKGKHPFSYGADKFEPNYRLIWTIRRFLYNNPYYDLVVWSGGGADYASHIASMIFVPKILSMTVRGKDMGAARLGDICVDDDPEMKSDFAVVMNEEQFFVRHCGEMKLVITEQRR